MLTREEYEKTYVRMMDSMRKVYIGEESCSGVICNSCKLQELCFAGSISFGAYRFIEIVEQWGKDHPVITN